MENTLSELTQNILTVSQRDYILDGIDSLQDSLFTSRQTIFELTTVNLSLPWSELLVRMYHQQNLLDHDKEGCKAILALVQKTVRAMETLEIRIAYNASEADVKDIRNWLLFQVKRQIILNIIVDPSLIGGIMIFKNGVYKDYSVASYIDTYGRV